METPSSCPTTGSEADKAACLVLNRVWPRVLARLVPHSGSPRSPREFEERLKLHLPRLVCLLLELYGNRWDWLEHVEQLLHTCLHAWLHRSEELCTLDRQRIDSPHWFSSEKNLGCAFYVDLFAGDLSGVRRHLPYLEDLGITYVHLMPLFDVPPGNSDGGYAVSSYRRVRPDLGTIEELSALAADLRRRGISLVLDFVFNHTADDHDWARAAKAGDREKLGFYHTFPDRTLPDLYQRTLRDIFPSVRRGSFTFDPALQRWVWTTFHSFQWDLDYSNPAVFNAMAGEMLFLANAGVEVLRLDAVAFIWKRMGTDCENQPEAHLLVQALNAVARIAAPALVFKSEAIVHPDEVIRYISPGECQLSYNPLLMALCWEALATREVQLLERALQTRHALPEGTAWVNYLRSHDDIGWTFDDSDARALGVDPAGHRRFLNDFYTGRFPGSFARGIPFQENAGTGDARVSGTLASLAGLEAALCAEAGSAGEAVEMALRRILLLHSVILSAGGIPLIYLGDELGQLNDYSYLADPSRQEDSRWAHRPRFPWKILEEQEETSGVSMRLRKGLERLIRLRKTIPAFGANDLEVVGTANRHVVGYLRHAPHPGRESCGARARVLVLANFSEHPQVVSSDLLERCAHGSRFVELISGEAVAPGSSIVLAPYQACWISPEAAAVAAPA